LGKGDIGCSFAGEDPHAFEPKMKNPLHPSENIWFTVCSDHTLKRLVRAAYESNPARKRLFQRKREGQSAQAFTWAAIVAVWRWDQDHLTCRRTALRRDAVFRDGFSDLRVWVALAVLQRRVLCSLDEIKKNLAASALPAVRVSSTLQSPPHLLRPPLPPLLLDLLPNKRTHPQRLKSQAVARDYDEMHEYLLELELAFVKFFLNNNRSEVRLQAVADLAPARRLYKWLR